MNKMKYFLLLLFLLSTTFIFADDCDVKGKGVYSIISNSQPAFIGFQKK